VENRKKLKSKKTNMLRSIGKQSGESVDRVSPEEEKKGYGWKGRKRNEKRNEIVLHSGGSLNFAQAVHRIATPVWTELATNGQTRHA